MRLSELEERELKKYTDRFRFLENIRGKTFLVTGSKGLVGSGVIKWLLFENMAHRAGVGVIASTRTPEALPGYVEKGDGIEFCRFGSEREFCAGRGVDYVIHAASPTGNSFHKAHPAQSLRAVIDATEEMLELCGEHAGCAMLYISSEEVYGLPQTEEPIPETYVGAIDSLSGRSCYPLGKKAAELLCHNYFLEYGLDVKIIRPTVIHGLLQRYEEERVANEILRCVVEGRNLAMKSDGSTKKCVLYSLDAVSAMLTVLFRGEGGEAYNASNPGTYMSVRDMAGAVFGRFRPGLEAEPAATDTAVAEGYLPRRTLLQDISKIRALGWEPLASLEEIYGLDIERFLGAPGKGGGEGIGQGADGVRRRL